MIDFADTKEVLLTTDYAYAFLAGKWTGTNNGYYLTMDEKHYINYNLPSYDWGTNYHISHGTLYFDNTKTTKKIFKFKIISYDKITVYCYKNDRAYTLYRR